MQARLFQGEPALVFVPTLNFRHMCHFFKVELSCRCALSLYMFELIKPHLELSWIVSHIPNVMEINGFVILVIVINDFEVVHQDGSSKQYANTF